MQIGMIGLGKMGKNLALNLLDCGHDVIGYDSGTQEAEAAFKTAGSLDELVSGLMKPRTLWVMVPSGDSTETVLTELSELLEPGDTVIDGGNSNYQDTVRRAQALTDKQLFFFDCGTSGGTEGARTGVCTMIGGDAEKFEELKPLFEGVSVPDGCLYTGKTGSGHFLKMIHNGIEYGMMQSIAEGFEILDKSGFDYKYEQVARVWNHGSIIRSNLMGLLEQSFLKDPELEKIRGVMNSSGEGKWTVETALDFKVPAPVIALSLMMRYRSLEDDTFTGKVVAALRNEFGDHAVEKK